MTPLLTAAELEERLPAGTLPLAPDSDEIDTRRVEIALDDATGIIVAQLPWLLDKETGDIVETIPPQFENAIRSFCCDIARHKLTDAVSSSEDEREWFKMTMQLIEKIDKEYKGGLSGPNLQESFVVEADAASGIPETRFFKKGRLF
jgi:phage gp36-like protein